MAKKLNKKLVGWLMLAACLLMLGGGFMVLQAMPQRDPKVHEDRAAQALAVGDKDKAVRAYMRAHAVDPDKNPRYLVAAAQLCRETGDIQSAIQICEQAITLSQSKEAAELKFEIFAELARAIGGSETWDKVAEEANRLIPEDAAKAAQFIRDNPSFAAHAYHARGEAYLNRRRERPEYLEKGIADLRLVVLGNAEDNLPPLSPTNVPAARGLRDILLISAGERAAARGAPDESTAKLQAEAAQVVAALTAAVEKSGTALEKAHAALTRLLFVRVVENQPPPPPFLSITVEAQRPDIEKALLDAEKFGEQSPAASEPAVAASEARGVSAPDLFYSLAQAWLALDKPEAVERTLRAGISKDIEDPRCAQMLADWLRRKDRLEDAAMTYRELLKGPSKSKGYRDLIIRGSRAVAHDQLMLLTLMRSSKAQDPAEKEKLLEEAEGIIRMAILEYSPDDPLIRLMRSRLLGTRGELVAATKELELASNSATRMSGSLEYDVQGLLCELYFRQNQIGAARAPAERMMKLKPNDPGPRVILARVQLAQNEPKQALDLLNSVLEPQGGRPAMLPNMAEALKLRVNAHSQLKNTEAAQGDLNRLRELGAGVGLDIQSAALAYQDRRFDEAEKICSALLAKEPANEIALDLLLNIFLSQDKVEALQPYVDKALKADPDNQRLKIVGVGINKQLSDDDRLKALLDIVNMTQDPFDRAIRLFNVHRQFADKLRSEKSKDTEKIAKAEADADRALSEAEKLKPDSQFAIELRFTFALQQVTNAFKSGGKPDFSMAEQCAKRAAEYGGGRGIDASGGKMYMGRVLMSKAECLGAGNAKEREAYYTQAATSFREGLDAYASNSNGWTFLAQCYAALNRPGDARAAAEKAIENQTNNGFAHKVMAAICQQQGDNAGFKHHVEEAARFGMANDEQVKEAMVIIAEQDKPLTVIPKLEEIMASRPDDVDNLVRLAMLYQRVERRADAIDTLKKAIALKPDDLGINGLLADEYANNRDWDQGSELLQKLLDKLTDPEAKARVCVRLAKFHSQFGARPEDTEKVEPLLKQARQLWVSLDTDIAYARYLEQRRRPDDAIAIYEDARKRLGSGGDAASLSGIRQELLRLAFVTNDPNKVTKYLTEYREANPHDPRLVMLDASVDLMRHDYDAARKKYEEQISKHPDDPAAYYQHGQLLAAEGGKDQLPRAIEDFRKAKEYSKRGLPGVNHRLALARCLVRVGQVNDAVVELLSTLEESLSTGSENWEEMPRIAEQYLNTLMVCAPPRINEAENMLRRLILKMPQEPVWQLKAGKLALDSRDTAKAMQFYNKALELANRADGKLVAIRYMLGCHDAKTQPDKVVELLGRADFAPLIEQDLLMPVQLASARWRLGSQDEAWNGFVAALVRPRFVGSPLAVRSMTLPMLEAMGGEALLARVDQDLKANPDEPGRATAKLIALSELKRGDEMVKLANEQLAQTARAKDKPQLLFLIATQLYTDKKFEEAASAYRQVLEADPNNTTAMNNLAYLLADDLRRGAEGLPFAEKAVALRGDDVLYVDTLGWCLARAGRYSEARGRLISCLVKQPDFIEARMHLGKTYKLEGKQLDIARQHLDAALLLANERKDEDMIKQIEAAIKEL